MRLRRTGYATGQRKGRVFPSQTPWKCTQKTHGYLSSLSQWSAPSSFFPALAAALCPVPDLTVQKGEI